MHISEMHLSPLDVVK